MTASLDLNGWLRPPKEEPGALVRLFCFPFGGGGASTFREWGAELGPEIEVWPVQLPGRETRWREPAYNKVSALLPGLGEAVAPYLDRPFALFGHSMGALISFELARHLRRLGLPQPVHLFVSARRGPQVPDRLPPIHALPQDQVVEQLNRRYNGIPQAIMESENLLNLFVPIFRADLELTETYQYTQEPPLACPISAFGGLADHQVTLTDHAAWGDQTTGAFTLRMLPGGHFFLQETRTRLLAALSSDLRQTLAENAAERAGSPAPEHPAP